ncbi:SPARC-related modular calcium-binding protein 1-like isoform X2 [Hypomesus transpacificus]|uniref:SPARC-related modular calcium-binding protein 1-like isoform X2 n=1 Tax=Hypomesus transpacificus TaxID=137520 RepID=UPI001F072316|nr:SPARC-related modular calcium-binding protein 1-like isoform X2 [Hypomesus transpacificus]
MLTLTFTCRVLLIFFLSETVQTDKSPTFLITENRWPRGCVLDCHKGRPRAVCGSNGRLYKSLCSFQRSHCINPQLRSVPRAQCADPGRSRCQLARSVAMESSLHTHTVAIFVPECTADGSFQQVQCHNQTGYCWCSTQDGKPVSGTSVLNISPNCTGHFSDMAQEMDLESVPNRDGGGPQATLDRGRPLSAEITVPPFWVTIQLNSDPRGNRSARRPTDSPQSCERERALLLSEVRPVWQEERFVPECSADGRYSPIQCHVATGYCWCVRVDTGRPLPGTSTRNRMPDCSPEESHTSQSERSYTDRPLPGCPGARKKEFLQSLIRALQLEAEHAGKLSPDRVTDTDQSNTSSPVSAMPPSSAPPQEAADWPSSGPGGSVGGALRWHFVRLDVDGSGVLSEREARPLRLFLRRRLKPRRCAKKFSQYCDRNTDRGLSLAEITACLGV